MRRVSRLVLTGILLLAVTGCTPAISPLYRDYEVDLVESLSDPDVLERIERGLENAGWTVVEGVTDNVAATELRTMRRWVFYDVKVKM